MPRGVKKSTADKLRQELEKIRKSISDHEEKIAALKEKEKERLPAEERTGLFRNIRAMMMHKLGTVVVNNTDNLLISAFVGVVSVGIYSNYYLLIGSVRQVLDQVFAGITASVGNLGATEDQGKIREIFETAFFIGQWLYGFAAICLRIAQSVCGAGFWQTVSV